LQGKGVRRTLSGAARLGQLNDKFRGKQLREHLKKAKGTRPRLTEDTATLLPVNFRSCRDTGITWLALAGVGINVIKSRAGHEDVDTTLGYLKMAEDLGGKVGQPFPPLLAELLGPIIGPSSAKPRPKWVPEEGVEPPT
jgi:integrase